MSQAKVDKRKQDKLNRKKTLAIKKAKKIAATVCACIIVVAIIAWAGVSGYNYIEKSKPSKTVYTQIDAITDYMDGLVSTEAAE